SFHFSSAQEGRNTSTWHFTCENRKETTITKHSESVFVPSSRFSKGSYPSTLSQAVKQDTFELQAMHELSVCFRDLFGLPTSYSSSVVTPDEQISSEFA